MHELTRADRLLHELRAKGIKEPVHLILGHIPQTQISLEEVIECFAIVTQHTPLQGSTIEFSAQETFLECQECGFTYGINMNELQLTCPNCNSKKVILKDDDELKILEIRPVNVVT